MKSETFTGQVEVFPDGWVYVKVPPVHSAPYLKFAQIGNIKISAQINQSAWNTLLWAFGDGTFFITIPARVRQKEKIEVGNQVKISFSLRATKSN